MYSSHKMNKIKKQSNTKHILSMIKKIFKNFYFIEQKEPYLNLYNCN